MPPKCEKMKEQVRKEAKRKVYLIDYLIKVPDLPTNNNFGCI
jgi:hypothetical protein